ncbi:ribosomal-protein-alanine N-acetyltransferase [Planifilum fimeticola]|jgi:[ribosomal protein S5]-alanine N-acetyltransferase|uniref:Ribosomal-protein-alanine N-acetyltransferase n=1 Tax=Planifilum fimeticola TaxID=201975 RepID=A0A2T0LAI5_9BACL|nr:GNAT family N-acetyltransferase [Planifilum fimeticola]PRX38861.1 ribosomal-protein-alanine N-acetyltransferase [Planifilum fimeticola]
MKVVLETDRLILRHFVMGDLDDLYRIYTQPGTMRYIGSGRVPGYAEVKDWLHRHVYEVIPSRGHGLYATVHRESGRLIGRCGLVTQEVDGVEELEVGYLIDRNYRGQGLATEAARALRDFAFRTKPVDRVISLIQSPNLPSRRVAEKNGMHLWKTTEFRGVSDVCVYRISRKEWEKLGG